MCGNVCVCVCRRLNTKDLGRGQLGEAHWEGWSKGNERETPRQKGKWNGRKEI
jgi:hypothetical protein